MPTLPPWPSNTMRSWLRPTATSHDFQASAGRIRSSGLCNNFPMLVLASASPRRRELLAQAGYTFQVLPADIAEDLHPGETPIGYVLRLAREKAESVAASAEFAALRSRNDEPTLILGADTTVVAPNGE